MTGQAAQSLGAGTLAIGDLIAQKYRVEGIVGRGGMGVVVSARHVQLGQTVAIKLLTLPPDEDRRDEAIARFLNEAQAAARLRSDHVVRIYDVGQLENGLPFMVMELLNGADLGTILDERGALPEPEAVDYVLQACAGVAEAHQLGVVHRDLKPSNLFVTRRSDGLPLLKVLDFGISKQLSDPSGEALPTFTNTRTLMGSPNYMSPEQIRDARRVDARADIWALGIILQELMTDAPVFRGESFPGVCAAIVADPPVPVRTMRPDVSDRLEAVIDRCLQKDVTKRYQSVAELVGDLVPLGLRTSSGPQAAMYSSGSQPRVGAAPRKFDSNVSFTSLDGPTVAMPSASTPGLSGHDRTLESARLAATAGTNSAVSAPNSRIEVVTTPRVPLAHRRWLGRFLLPLGLVVLAVGALLWFRGPLASTAPTASADARAPSAPARVAASPFTLSIDSEPAGASVSEGSVHVGTTPFSLTLDLPEGSSPRVFVVEKEGFQPYVVRQAPAHGQVRVMAALSQKVERPAAPAPSVTAHVEPPKPVAIRPSRPSTPAPKRSAAPPPKPPSDIRLER